MLWFEVGTLGLNEIDAVVAGGMRHLANNVLEQWFCPNSITFMQRELQIGDNPLLNG